MVREAEVGRPLGKLFHQVRQKMSVANSMVIDSTGVENLSGSTFILRLDPIELADILEMGERGETSHQRFLQD